MDSTKSKALLNKINALHESASSFDGTMSAMEKDLLLHYLRELYEVISQGNNAGSQRPEVNQKISQDIPSPVAPVTYRNPEPVVYAPPPQVPTYRDPVQHHVPDPRIVENGRHYQPQPQFIEPEVQVDESLLALFNLDDAADMSSRFSQLPISDISKSMGINDKILTKNELFGGDSIKFDRVMSELNSFNTYEQAKNYLMKGIAAELDWGSERKRSKAEVFIKLVKRKYLK